MHGQTETILTSAHLLGAVPMELLELFCLGFPSLIVDLTQLHMAQKAVPVPTPSLIASNAPSANSLLNPSRLLSLSLLSHSLRFFLFSLCFSSISSSNFFLPSSSSAKRFFAAGSNALGKTSPPGTIAGTEAR